MMTVGDLISDLQQYDPNHELLVMDDTGALRRIDKSEALPSMKVILSLGEAEDNES